MTQPLTYSIVEAARRLGGPFTVDWIKGHINEIPKVRVGSGRGKGGRIGFTEAHLVEIVEKFSERPEDMPAPGGQDEFSNAIVSRRSA